MLIIMLSYCMDWDDVNFFMINKSKKDIFLKNRGSNWKVTLATISFPKLHIGESFKDSFLKFDWCKWLSGKVKF